MLKRILKTVAILGFLLLPLFTFAQLEGPQECCRAHQTFVPPDARRENFNPSLGADATIEIEKGERIMKSGGYCNLTLVSRSEVPSNTLNDYVGKDWAIVCLLNTTINVTNWIFYLMMILSVLLVVWGGIIFMTAGGDPDKASKGKTLILYACIGIIIALLARIIPAIVRFIV